MSPGEAVKLVLAADVRVSGRVGARMYPGRIPAGMLTFPALVYSVVSEVPADSFESNGRDLSTSRIQISCFAKQYIDADALAEAVSDVLLELDSQDLRALKLDRRDLFEDDALLHNVVQDFSVLRGR